MVDEPQAVSLVFASPELSPEVVVLVAEPGADYVSGPQASVDIAFAFVVLVPVSVFEDGADSSERPKFPAFPNVYYFASPSSSVEVAG